MQMFIHEVATELFTSNLPDPHYWTPNSYFGVFRNVWVHLGTFRYCVKLGANQAELVQLMQKFVQRSGLEIFHNEGTRSKPLHPKLLF